MQSNQLFTPLGWNVFGEVEIVGRVKTGVVAQTVESFTPELASLFSTLFVSVFGRRLGTVDDGTTLSTISNWRC